MRLSHSQLGEWPHPFDNNAPGCEFRWALNHIWHAPTVPNMAALVGTALHAAIEADGRAKLTQHEDLTLDQLQNIAARTLDEEIAKADPKALFRNQYDNMRTRCQTMVTAYAQHVQHRYAPTQAPEKEFMVTIGDVQFSGKIDAKARSIIDWKNAKEIINKWGREWIDDAAHADQATAYLLADATVDAVQFVVFACHPDEPLLCHVKTYTVQRDADRATRYVERVKLVADQIKTARDTGQFNARIHPLCRWCGVLGACRLGQAAIAAQGKSPEVPTVAHTDVCGECAAEATAVSYHLRDGKASITFRCANGHEYDLPVASRKKATERDAE